MTASSQPSTRRASHQFSWTVFSVMLLFAAVFVNQTAHELPRRVAVHFDALGQPQSFMASGQYRLFVLLFTAGLPLVLVVVMTYAYTRVQDLKIPNRDYWLGPRRIERTRGFLMAHGMWFGTLLVALMCFLHWLVFDANKHVPVQLSNRALLPGLSVFLICTIAWIGAFMAYFRRPGIDEQAPP